MKDRWTRCAWLFPLVTLLVPVPADAGDEEDIDDLAAIGYHPWAHTPRVRTVDLSAEARAAAKDYVSAPVEQPDFWSLDDFKLDPDEIPPPDPANAGKTPDGWVQRGSVVLPEEVALGLKEVELEPIWAVEDIPGNKYPRKHTLFLNFNGGMLYSGKDNSAENRSTLAKQGIYPTFAGGEQTALAIVQAVQNDVAPYGIRVMYDKRPRKLVPYTMEMIGGHWTDTNLDSPAGGVAPGADCGALGQRHVVYTFSNGGSVTGAANTASQEAGHAWGLDHTFNCASVMSYCGGGDGSFQDSCDGLCESQCQGPNSAGCRLTHEMFCGQGNNQQNDHAELTWIFGGNEPDLEPPTVEIVEPEDGLELPKGADVVLRAIVDDNYGGFGWKFVVEKDGEVIWDQPDYDRDVDDEYRAALHFTKLDPGTYVLTVEAEDHFENVTRDSVTIYVGVAAGDSGSGTGGDDEGGDGTTGGGDSEADDGFGSGGIETEGDSGGTATGKDGGCSIGSRSSSVPALLMLGLIGFVTRRRLR